MKKNQDILERVTKIIGHIEQNLDKELTLEELSTWAHFSPFHFQRIFKEIVGETPKQFIKRLRLEEAAHYIVLHQDKSLLEVALHVGFQSLEVFSRAFKDYYSISPDNFRKCSEIDKIKICQKSTVREKQFDEKVNFLSDSINKSEYENLDIKIAKRPAVKFIYLQATLESADVVVENMKKVKRWAQARNYLTSNTELFYLFKDYPLYTSIDKCRCYTCLSVEMKPELSGLIIYEEHSSKTYSSFHVHGGIVEIYKAVTYWFHFWLPESGYKVIHEHFAVLPLNDPTITPFNENNYQIFLQIEPL